MEAAGIGTRALFPPPVVRALRRPSQHSGDAMQGISVQELSRRIRVPPNATRELLDRAAQGLVTHNDDGSWRLSLTGRPVGLAARAGLRPLGDDQPELEARAFKRGLRGDVPDRPRQTANANTGGTLAA